MELHFPSIMCPSTRCVPQEFEAARRRGMQFLPCVRCGYKVVIEILGIPGCELLFLCRRQEKNSGCWNILVILSFDSLRSLRTGYSACCGFQNSSSRSAGLLKQLESAPSHSASGGSFGKAWRMREFTPHGWACFPANFSKVEFAPSNAQWNQFTFDRAFGDEMHSAGYAPAREGVTYDFPLCVPCVLCD